MLSRNDKLLLCIGKYTIKGIFLDKSNNVFLIKELNETGVDEEIKNFKKFKANVQNIIKLTPFYAKIKQISIFLSADFIKYKQFDSENMQIKSIISQNIINDIEEKIQSFFEKQHYKIIYRKIINFTLDEKIILNPIGLYANEFKFKYLLAYCHTHKFAELSNLIKNLTNLTPEIFPFFTILNNNFSKDNLIFDIGAKTINWFYSKNNQIEEVGFINLGSQNISEAIAKKFQLTQEESDAIKNKYAYASITPEYFCNKININGNLINHSEIILATLPQIDLIVRKIENIIKIHRIKNIKFIGNGSKLKGFEERFKQYNVFKNEKDLNFENIQNINIQQKFWNWKKILQLLIFINALYWLIFYL